MNGKRITAPSLQFNPQAKLRQARNDAGEFGAVFRPTSHMLKAKAKAIRLRAELFQAWLDARDTLRTVHLVPEDGQSLWRCLARFCVADVDILRSAVMGAARANPTLLITQRRGVGTFDVGWRVR